MPWRVALLVPVLVALAAIVLFGPWLRAEREVLVATPQPPPLFEVAPIELGLGGEACTGPVAIDRGTDVLRIFAGRYAETEPSRLKVEVRGRGYRVRQDFEEYADGQALDTRLPDPPRPVDALVCVESAGPTAGLLRGAAEARTRGRLVSTFEGEPTDRELVVLLLAREPSAVAGRLGEVIDHAAAFKPGVLGPGALWVLALAVALGLPLGAAAALRAAPPSDPDQA